MADNSLTQTLKKWQALSPRTRKISAIVAVVGVVAFIVFGAGNKPIAVPVKTNTPNQNDQINLGLPGSNGHDITVEKLTANMESIKNNQREIGANLDRVTKEAGERKPPTTSPETEKELAQLRAEIAEMKNKQSSGSLDEALPSAPAANAPVAERSMPAVEAPREPDSSMWSIGPQREQAQDEAAQDEKKKAVVYLPAGSNFEGVLMNGMEAPTSSFAQKQPTPALMRLKTDAILPNRYRYDVRECFMILSGYGVLSTERANLQTVVMSCVKNDGSVIEAKVEGYVVGEDGKVGMRGNLISRQGQLLAKSFASGFFSGLGQMMSPMAVPQMNIAPGATTQYQMPNIPQMATGGLAQGVTQSANSLSQFYLSMAKDMFPVVEIGADRRATVILLKGFELNMIGEKR